MDCLSLLHDVLIEFTTVAERSTFDYWNQSLTYDSIVAILKNQPLPSVIGSNVTRNAELAFDLRHQINRVSMQYGIFNATRHDIDNYVETLLTQYRILR